MCFHMMNIFDIKHYFLKHWFRHGVKPPPYSNKGIFIQPPPHRAPQHILYMPELVGSLISSQLSNNTQIIKYVYVNCILINVYIIGVGPFHISYFFSGFTCAFVAWLSFAMNFMLPSTEFVFKGILGVLLSD